MWKKHVLLPLWAGLVTCVPALHAYDTPTVAKDGLYFIENKGQIVDQHRQSRHDLDFKLNAGKGLNIFLGAGKMEYQWYKAKDIPSKPVSLLATSGPEASYTAPAYDLCRMEVTLVGANAQASVIREQQHAYYERYYLPSVPPDGAKGSAWQKITYQEVYPHIDWVFYFNAKGQLEHDFIVRPGGKVSDIRLQYGGTTQVQSLADGSLLARTPLGTAKEQAPVAYDGSGSIVASRFLIADNTVTFEVGPYSGTLVIDPVLEWGTYFGGPDIETGRAITTDKHGYVYLTGTTGSLANIATTGAFQTTYGGGIDPYGADAFLSKWNKEGQLIWSTYYGGSALDVALAISCDTADKIYLGGYTNSKDVMSTPGAHQEVKAGTNAGNDCFLVQFDSTGQRLWSTYFGGTGTEGSMGVGVATDRSGNIYFTGNTGSTGGIATPGAHQTARGTGNACFLAKFNTAGSLQWSTYYSGNSNDYPQGCATDSLGNIYLTGYTQSSSGIATTGAYQTVPNGKDDVFISKFNPDGQLVWGSYFGGNETDRGLSITVSHKRLYVGGGTLSTSSISSSGSHQPQLAGGEDGLIISMNTDGQFAWATYYGGEFSEVVLNVWANANGDIYVCGPTFSKTGFTTPGAFKEELKGSDGNDLYIAKINSEGLRVWGTYYGGLDNDYYGYLTGDNANNLYLTGITSSPTQIASTNAYQNNLNGVSDVLLVRFNDCPKPEGPEEIMGLRKVCDSSVHQYRIKKTGNYQYQWILSTFWDLVNEEDSLVELRIKGSGLLQIVATNDCGEPSDTQSLWIATSPIPLPAILNNKFILSTDKSYTGYQWIFNEEPIPGATQPTYIVTKDGWYSVNVIEGDSCTGEASAIEVTGSVSVNTADKIVSPAPYPNPARHEITVTVTEKATLEIFTIEGRKISTTEASLKGPITLALDELANGIYLLKIETSNAASMYQFTKQQ